MNRPAGEPRDTAGHVDWQASQPWGPDAAGWVLDAVNNDGDWCLWAGRPGNPNVWRPRSTSVLPFAAEPGTTMTGVRVFATPDAALDTADRLDRSRLADEPAAITVRQAVAWVLGG